MPERRATIAHAIRRPDPALHPGRADGEPVGHRLVAQPLSAAASLAYLGAGAFIWRRRTRDPDPTGAGALALAVAANGVGGIAFHGPGDRVSHWLHDAALCATLAIGAVRRPGLASSPRVLSIAAGSSCILVAIDPRVTNLLSGTLAAGMAGQAVAASRRGLVPDRRSSMLAVASGLLGAAMHRLARPTSSVHVEAARRGGHAGWHLLSALSLAALGTSRWTVGTKPGGDSPTGAR